MKRSLRSALCLLLVFLMLLTVGCQKPADPTGSTGNPADSTQNTQPEKPFVPTLRFVVTSDIHIREKPDDMQSHQRLSELYETAYDYADNHPDYKKLDAIFFVGDNTNDGTEAQLTYFFDFVKKNTREGTIARAVMGNHEFKDTGYFQEGTTAQSIARFLEISGYESEDIHLTIGGYHFILLSTDLYDKDSNMFISAPKLAWLRQELDAAKADTPDKPIFVFQHEPPLGTMVGSTSKAADQLLNWILKEYPQVIDFSGHTHVTMVNPQSIWQKEYTAINTASLAYLSLPMYDVKNKMTRPAQGNDTGGLAGDGGEEGVRNAAMYYIVEIDAEGVVRLLRYDIFTKSIWGDPIIFDSIDPADFKYTSARKEQAEKPVFDASAAITVESADAANPQISFPQAICKDGVTNYRIEFYQNDSLVHTIYRLSENHYGDATPNPLKTNLGKLKPGTYTLKVYATSSYALHSEPITADLTLN